MNKKQIFIVLCLFIVSLLAVSAVSATDVVDDLNLTTVADNQDIIQVTDTQEDFLADSAGTFTQLKEKIQGESTVTLDGNYTYTSEDSILSGGIAIDSDITIDGAGYTIDGANQASIFSISGNSHVVLKNINFVNAKGTDGAALRWTSSDSVEIINSCFINNSASGNGGAIYIASTNSITSTSIISGSRFINNSATTGAAIYAEGTTTINHSTFDGNNVSNDGAALYVNGDDVRLYNSIFTNNIAGDDGGAIYWTGSNGIISNITCINNKGISIDKPDGSTSSTRGGTICLTGSDIIISESTFTSGQAWMADGKDVSKVDGGALFITGNNVNITDTTFSDCSATHNGGAIYIIGNNALVDNCTFDNCTSDNNGGVIYVNGSDATINTATFTNNKVRFDGGAIYVAGDDGKLYNSIFTYNTAGDDGGAIYWEGQRGIIYNITCTNNNGTSEGKSSTRGGTISVIGSDVTVNRSRFSYSIATIDEGKDASKIDGGALFITGNDVNIIDTTFDNCGAAHDGGAIYIIGNNTNIVNATFDKCTAVEGGSIYIEGQDTHIFQSEIANSLSFDAGGVYVNGPNTVISANFINCTAGVKDAGSGGAIYVSGFNTNITESTFLNSTAYGGDGGAVFVGGSYTTIEKSDFKFTEAADGKGGAIYIAGNYANVLDSTFNEVHAEYGGAVYIGGFRMGENAKVLDCNITSSTSDSDGGAIYVAGINSLISVNINNTRALGVSGKGSGGAIYVGGDDSNITATHIENCSAGVDGGAIYIEGDEANVEKSTIHNTHALDGGAIYIQGEDAVVTESNFTGCYAGEGGAIYIDGGYATVESSNIADCYADEDGGAIYISGGNVTVISDSTFDNCSAVNNDGGAIYVKGYVTEIKGSEFTNCIASSQNGAGGAIYIKGDNTTVTDAKFDSCVSVDGGAIYIDGNYAHVYGSEFVANVLVDYADDDNYGGAIYVNGASAVISTSTFEGHKAFTGGSIYINGTDTVVKDSNFTKSTADYGGAIFIQGINAKVTSSDITNSSSVYDGGAIYVNGTNAFISADFAYCIAGYEDFAGNGGAIYVNGADADITDSTFMNCVAMNDGDGGAIYVAGINTNVEKSTFQNTNAREGGAIYIEGASAKVYDSDFENSNAHDGGAIYIEGNNTQIDNVDIASSYADQNGGAIYVHGVHTEVRDSTFTQTHTQDGVGGAINIVGENTTIKDSNFTNSNSTAGGAIYVTGDNAAIMGSAFSDMISDTSGGAIYVAGDNTRISGDAFDSCKSLGTGDYSGGGAIYVAGDGTSISESRFTNSNSKKYGGAIYVAGKNSNIASSNFTLNYADHSAGAIYISKYTLTVNGRSVTVEAQNTTIEDCLFNVNTAKISGGAVRVSGTNTTIERSHFTKNKVTAGWGGDSQGIGGALYIDGINATVEYSSFTENVCSSRGGAIFWNGGHGGDSIIGCNFTRNNATSNNNALGGAVYWSVGKDRTPGGLVKDTIFDSNYAAKHGGGMDWYRSCNSTMVNCTFINNSALKDGGGFYIGDTNGVGINITVIDCKFFNNTAGYAGGALSNQMSASHFINLTFIGNKAKFGGSIIIKDAVTKDNEIIGCTFINSVAENNPKIEEQVRGKGGAIFARDNTITVDDCTFTNCTALDGGAIYWNGGMNYILTNPSSLDKTAYLGLGGVVSNSRFYNNTAVRGGAVYWQATNGTINNSNFTGNNATDGGALYWEGGVEYMHVEFNYPATFVVHGENGKVYDSIFTQNNAQNGGAVYWTGTNGIIDNSEFIENEANKGGAVYWNNITQTATYTVSKTVYNKTVSAGQNGLISESKFFKNHAEGSDSLGGALYWNTSSSSVEDAEFFNNTAKLGGAIYWVNGESIDGSTFRYNKAENGSAMYVDESAPRMDIVDSSFLENRANANRFDPFIYIVDDDEKTINLTAYFRGNDNIINAIYNAGEDNVYFTNVNYLGADGVRSNTGAATVAPVAVDVPEDSNNFYQTDCEVNQIVEVTLYGAYNEELARETLRTDSEGKISLYYDDLSFSKGSLKVKLIHPEDNYYTFLGRGEGANLTLVFIETADIDCLDDEIINITVVPYDDAIMEAPTGNISLWINGTLFEGDFILTHEDGSRCATVTVVVPRCAVGTYDVKVRYNGDDDFLPEENVSSFKVREINDDIIVETIDIKVGEIEPIDITVFPTNKVTGNVSVYLAGNNLGYDYLGKYELDNGKIHINKTGLRAGSYTVIAFYEGDSNFKPVSNVSSFVVTKHDPYFIVEADDIFVYDNGFIRVILPENATGIVYLKVNGTQYYINLTNGERNITLPPFLDDGIYNVWGNYSGDDYWYSAVNTTTFKVSKYNITLDVETADIVYGDIEQLNVTMQFVNATGNVTIRINDTLRVFENVPIVNGVARVNVTGLVPGFYTVDVSYPGDRRYNGNVTSGNFTVDKAHIPIIIVPQNFTFMEKGIAHIYVDTYGWVNATIADDPKNNRMLIDGEVSYDLKDLDPGIYTITAHFFGNEYYYEDTNQTVFEVYKLNRTVDIKVHDIIYGDYEDLQAFVNATGNVTIFVNGENRTIVLEDKGYGGQGQSVGHFQDFNGKAQWNLYDLPVGEYPVHVDYNGNGFYFPASADAVFRVIPANTTLSIAANDIKVWDNEYLNVTVKDAKGKVIRDASGNITLNIGDDFYTAEINNGVAIFIIPDLSVGEKVVWAFYDGDRNHNGNSSRTTFMVGQRIPVVNVTGQDINAGQTENIHIEIPANATGYVVLTGNFTEYPIYIYNFNGGIADITFVGLAVGEYSAHITYYGDEYDNYTIGEADASFEVYSINTPISIVVDDIYYKQTANITVKVNEDATGFITVNVVNGSGIVKKVELPVVNGTVNFLVDDLAVDTYEVQANYSGDANYNSNATADEFDVKKIAPTITIESVEANAARNATVIVHITPGTTGEINITVNNKNYSAPIENGVARFIIDQLNYGNYTVDAYYAGDRNYTEASTSAKDAVKVHRFGCYDMDVVAQDTKVELNSTITVTVPIDAEGEVAIYVNGTFAGNAAVNEGIAQLNVTKYISGKYVVNATFIDGKYADKTVTTNYYVYPWDTPIVITIEDEDNIHVGDVVKVIVNVPEDVKENVTIEIDGKSYTNVTYGGDAVFYVSDLIYGDKTVVATYDGDNKYVFNSTTANFTVLKYDIEIAVNGFDINVGDIETITVKAPQDITRPVVVVVDGNSYSVNVTNGIGTLDISNLASGSYNVTAMYLGDDKYNGAKAKDSFIVSKVPSFVIITAENITVGDKEVIEISTPADLSGNVTVAVDGKNYTVFVSGGHGTLVVSGLEVGPYDASVAFAGSVKYLSSENFTAFKVSPATPEIFIVDKGNSTVEVIIGDNATGNVTITVEGKNFTGEVINGTATIIIENVTPGEHNVTAVYYGDKNHTNATANGTVTVPKLDTPIFASADDIMEGENATVVIKVPANATGNVTVTIDGKQYEAELVNGAVNVTVEGLTAGPKSAFVVYPGDDNYVNNYTVASFNVEKIDVPPVIDTKLDTPIFASAEDIMEGENATVVISLPINATGKVNVTIDRQVYVVELVNGAVNVTVEGLTAGPKSAFVVYPGDDNYVNNYTVAEFNVEKVIVPLVIEKLDTPIVVNVTDIKEGENATITIEVPANATGNVTVTIDGKEYVVEVVNGTATVIVENLTAGPKTVIVEYPGDDNYVSNYTVTEFNVEKVIVPLVIEKLDTPIVVNITDIKEGENATITIEVPANATGNVTVTIDGKEYVVEVVNGTATVIVENLTAGPKTVIVEYPGDDNYINNYTVTTFTVEKVKVVPDITVVDQGNGTVIVIVGDNATGNVTITVEGKNFTGEVINGTAVITLENVTPGVHNITVVYSGDETHTNATANGTATIPKAEAIITVESYDIYVGDSELISVTLPNDAGDNALIEIDGKVYEPVAVEDNVIRFVVEGLTAGPKTVVAYYDGNDNYNGRNVTDRFNVFKRNSTVSGEIADIYVGENAVVNVKVIDDATGQVLIDIDGMTYYANVTDGIGSVEIPNLLSGSYTVELTYVGDDKYLPSSNVATFNVNKLPSYVIPAVEDITVGEKAVIVISTPADLYGTVTVTVDGEEYTVSVSEGQGTLVVSGLVVGLYDVSVAFDGNDKYVSSENSTEFKVSPIDTEITVIDHGNGTVTVIVGDNATGNVTITVEGKNFTGEVINGTAVITLENVTPGVHDIEVVYSGDETHTNASVDTTVTIPKGDISISFEAYDIYVGDSELIDVILSNGAGDNVVIEIDGKVYEPVAVDEDAVRFVIEDLTAGPKTVTVEYAGDDSYNGRNVTDTFTVFKHNSTVSGEIADVFVGENVVVIVKVIDDATGQVLIDIDGVTYYANVSDGIGSVEIPRMLSGTYPVNLTYVGDDKYLPSSNVALSNVYKVPSFVIPIAENIYVGDLENILLTVPGDAVGNVTLVINGEEINIALEEGVLAATYSEGTEYFVAVSGGNGVLVISDIPEGEYSVYARYNGDDKYLPSENETVFTVTKYVAPEIVREENETGDVQASNNETESVSVPENPQEEVVQVIEENPVDAERFDGTPDDNTGEVVSVPVDTPISITVHDIYVGETETVVVTLPSDATGKVIIVIDGAEYSTTEIVDGKATFQVDGLTAGEKTVDARYETDNDNYVNNSTTGQFVVYKLPSSVNATGNDITVGEDEVIEIVVPNGATGNITVEIDGKLYSTSEIVDGKAKVTVSEIPAGEYTAKVYYGGNDKYLPSNNTFTFKVSEAEAPVEENPVEEDDVDDGTEEDESGEGEEEEEMIKGVPADVTEANSTGADGTPETKKASGEGVSLSQHETGNPLLVLLLGLLVIGSSQIRRFK